MKTNFEKFMWVTGIIITAYHLIVNSTLLIQPSHHTAIHVSLALFYTFMIYPATKKRNRTSLLDKALALFSLVFAFYKILYFERILLNIGNPNIYEIALGICLIILVLESVRRVMGVPLLIAMCVFLAYAYFGAYIPGTFGHKGYGLARVAEEMFLSPNGIYGSSAQVSASFVFLFILFSAILQKSGGDKILIDMAMSLVGRYRGGPAKVAVVSSGFMGTISGSAFANVMGTGSITIPLMKELGYPRHFAAGVESAASTGGQFTPPVMGAAGFIMAETLGLSYGTVALAAVVPAFLYYWSLFVMVDLKSAQLGLKGLEKDRVPSLKNTLKKGWHLLIPIIAIFYLLLSGQSPLRASLVGVMLTAFLSSLRSETRMNFKQLFDAMADGAKSAMNVAIPCAACGIIICVTGLTGVGLKLSNLIFSIAQNQLFLALSFAAVASIILGMGMPTIAVYVTLAMVIGPGFNKLGLEQLPIHLFILYYGLISAVTPPVCMTSYLAAGIAGAEPNKAAIEGFKLSLAAFIIPFYFVYNPNLLLSKNVDLLFLVAITTATIGTIALAAAIQGYLLMKTEIFERILLLVAALTLIQPGFATDIMGIGLLTVLLLYQKYNITKMVTTQLPKNNVITQLPKNNYK